MNPDEIPGGIFGGFDSGSFAVGCAAGSALKRLLHLLAQVLGGVIVAVAVVKAHVVGVHIVDVQVAVGVVVAIRLVVPGISEPPSAAVFSPPRALLSSVAPHGVLGAATTTVGGTSHVNNEVRLLRVVVDILLHHVVHDGPVVLVARRPDLVAIGARVRFSALPDPSAIMNPDEIPGGIFGGFDSGSFAVGCAAGSALKRLLLLCCLLAAAGACANWITLFIRFSFRVFIEVEFVVIQKASLRPCCVTPRSPHAFFNVLPAALHAASELTTFCLPQLLLPLPAMEYLGAAFAGPAQTGLPDLCVFPAL